MDLERLEQGLRNGTGVERRLSGERRAAVAILLDLRDGEAEVLLMRRAQRAGDRWSGHIGLPGGHTEPRDPSPLATAVRETAEEVGLELARCARLLGRLDPVQAKTRGRRLDLFIDPFVFRCTGEACPCPGPEADETFWFPLDRAARGELSTTIPAETERGRVELPAWDFEGRVVWGLTYEILHRVLERAD